ncbi:MAG: SDR family NAD(P)-dependent oxidoreductase [Puniceicoccales bacterium]|jgi:nucleoside-diphosphate-sugar epimerase|nr:SDR family NAD(P)-dependent oxidoreductase [Puniceicoccales bacterium]
MSTYLVTGAAGFIGSEIAGQLLEAGHAVAGLDNLNDSCDARLKQHRLGRLNAHPRFEFHKADITIPGQLRAVFSGRKIAAVLHLAARPGVRASVEQPAACVETNVNGTLNVLEAMREAGVSRLALASTSSLYAGETTPFHEGQCANAPRSPYSASKKAAEALARAWHHLHGFDVAVLRYFTVYGPAGRPDMSVLRFIQAIAEGRELSLFGDGSQRRDWTYVEDIARGSIAAVEKVSGHEIINLGGGGTPVAVNEIIAFLETEIGRAAHRKHAPTHPADMPETSADTSKAARLLGWSPRVSWREGLRRTVAWYRENASWLAAMRM